jgi:hypothetical protein
LESSRYSKSDDKVPMWKVLDIVNSQIKINKIKYTWEVGNLKPCVDLENHG